MSRRKPDPVTGELQLTHRERIFINEYIKNGGNGKQAAIAAGYGAARADQSAYQVLHRIQVQQEIQDRISESDVCAKEIIGTLASFMRGNIAQLLDDDGNFDLDLVKQRRKGLTTPKSQTIPTKQHSLEQSACKPQPQNTLSESTTLLII